ncbi:MAG: NAD(P)H-hydrate dehydratase [Pseudomonadota bacterium]
MIGRPLNSSARKTLNLLATGAHSISNRILTTRQMAQSDRYTAEVGVFSGTQLMARAGAAVVDVLLSDFIDANRFVVLAGPGNNGGDGYVVAELLRQKGLWPLLFAFGEPKEGTDSHWAKTQCGVNAEDLGLYDPRSHDVVVDALFGAGGRPALPTVVKSCLEQVCKVGARVVAVDVPSGMDADTGAGGVCPAHTTVTFHALKPGLISAEGLEKCGEIHVADIGIRTAPHETGELLLYRNSPDVWASKLPQPRAVDHKYSRGHVAVYSGSVSTCGAARLSAMAAQAAGAGAVTLLCPDQQTIHVHAGSSASIMTRIADDGGLKNLQRCNSCVMGPGFGSDHALLRNSVIDLITSWDETDLNTLVLDADVFTAFADTPDHLFEAIRNAEGLSVVLTPHAGEFARIFPDLGKDLTNEPKWKLTQAAAARSGATIVFKGSDTVIADPADPKIVINAGATARLAMAGSGDVLAGLIAGLAAQGMSAKNAACAAVWLHANAADRDQQALTPERLIEALRSRAHG